MEDSLDNFRLALAIIWTIWKARNEKVFNNKDPSPEAILRHAQLLFNDYKNPPLGHIDLASYEDSVPNHAQLPTHWSPPPIGYIKVNVDGACSEGATAAAAVARDHNGAFVGCASQALDYGTSITAEANAFLLSLPLIDDLQLSNVIIEGDAELIVQWINDPNSVCDWRVLHIMQQCRRKVQIRNDITCKFSPRATNGAAHALARFSVTHHVTHSWSEGIPPPHILDPIFADLAFIVNTVHQ